MGNSHPSLVDRARIVCRCVYVVAQFYPWFKFYFPWFWCMVMYDNEFKTKGNKI